jgi:DNA-binding MurR/RpiR family transcriptional regulator
MIVSSRVRYVIGMRGCKGIALQFGRLLSFMLPNVITLIDGECTSINSLQDVREGDVVIMFALSRFYKIDMSYIRMARERGAGICLVEDDITGPLSSYADVVLMANVSNMSFFHSTIGVNVLAEYILNLVSDKAEFKERIEERDRVTQDQRM